MDIIKKKRHPGTFLLRSSGKPHETESGQLPGISINLFLFLKWNIVDVVCLVL